MKNQWTSVFRGNSTAARSHTERCRAFLSCFLLAIAGCGPVHDPRGSGSPDLCPPSIQSVRTVGPGEVELLFDEEALIVRDKLRFQPELTVSRVPGPGTRLILGAGEQVPGRHYTMEAVAEDSRGNTVRFMADFYGFNPRVPRLVMNEFRPRGSQAHPDLLEIKVQTDGDMGGIVLYQGTPGEFESRLIFPSFPVRAGQFILVHFKPSGDPGEVNETEDQTVSTGLDCADSAFDFWIADCKGMGGNNGVLSLYDRPGGGLLDGVLYSNRTSSSDESYGGFGTAGMLAKAEELARDGGWKTAAVKVAPEDGVNPEGSTATRSICRSSQSMDTDDRADWHIVPTRKSSFGRDNSDDVFRPGGE